MAIPQKYVPKLPKFTHAGYTAHANPGGVLERLFYAHHKTLETALEHLPNIQNSEPIARSFLDHAGKYSDAQTPVKITFDPEFVKLEIEFAHKAPKSLASSMKKLSQDWAKAAGKPNQIATNVREENGKLFLSYCKNLGRRAGFGGASHAGGNYAAALEPTVNGIFTFAYNYLDWVRSRSAVLGKKEHEQLVKALDRHATLLNSGGLPLQLKLSPTSAVLEVPIKMPLDKKQHEDIFNLFSSEAWVTNKSNEFSVKVLPKDEDNQARLQYTYNFRRMR